MNEDEFRNWAINTVQHETTVEGYINSLKEDIPNYLNISSLFDEEDIHKLQELYDRCSIGKDLYDWNKSIGNGRPKSALKKYKEFLTINTNIGYVERILEKIDAVDVMQTIREYENSTFENDNTKNRYFKLTKSIYILPSKYCIKTTLIKKGLSGIATNLTSNYAENILRIIFEDENIEFIDSNKTNPFLPLYQEIAKCLIEYRDNHGGLIDILEDMKKNDLKIIPLKDKNINGETNLKDIDPFTFFSTFNRSITVKNRANILKYLREDWELEEKIPTFTPNIPWVNPQNAWFFRWEKIRNKNDINILWEMFAEILNDNIKETTFNKCINLQQVDNKLSFGLFWLNSDKYITTDSGTREYLEHNILSYNGNNLRKLEYKGYFELLSKIKKEIPNKSFYEIVALKGDNIIEVEPVNSTPITPIYKNQLKNIILYGVPGVGKTYSHKKIIDLIESKKYSDNEIFEKIETHDKLDFYEVTKKEDRVKFITFHQSFGYEDFIEGFRPDEDGEIKLRNGVFKDLCENAKNDLKKNYYLVIDEINRGNISKIFGELITLIEEDKRDSLHVTLPYSKEEFSIPSNIYIIGTMNSTDKSIALIDIALRRRFTFVHMVPNPELVKYDNAKKLMIKLNEKLDSEYQIGHSYFMNIKDERDLVFTCKYKIKPLLEEYFYGNEKELSEILELL